MPKKIIFSYTFLVAFLFSLNNIFLGNIEGNGLIGVSSLIKIVSWFLLFLISIFGSMANLTDMIIYIPLVFFFLSVLSGFLISKNRTSITYGSTWDLQIYKRHKNDIFDTIKANFYRSIIDFTDKISLFLFAGDAYKTGYLFRQELLVKDLSFTDSKNNIFKMK